MQQGCATECRLAMELSNGRWSARDSFDPPPPTAAGEYAIWIGKPHVQCRGLESEFWQHCSRLGLDACDKSVFPAHGAPTSPRSALSHRHDMLDLVCHTVDTIRDTSTLAHGMAGQLFRRATHCAGPTIVKGPSQRGTFWSANHFLWAPLPA